MPFFRDIVWYEYDTFNLHSVAFINSDKSRKEVEFLQAAFESYKTQLHIEHGNRWRQLEEETRKKLTEDLEKKTAEISILL